MIESHHGVKLGCETCGGTVYIPRSEQEEGMVCPSCEEPLRTVWYGDLTFE